MKKRVSKKQNILSTNAQTRCIWMTAGVISFKLCPFNYDCEHCHFDVAMRSQVRSERVSSRAKKHKPQPLIPSENLQRSRSDSKKSLLFFTFSIGEVEEGLYFHPSHLWARRTGEQTWRLGIDKLLAYVLPPPVKVELYDSDKEVTQNQVFGKIHTQVGTVFLTVPLSGDLVQTNSRLSQRPELVQQDPYGEGWLAMIDRFKDHSELEKFYTGLAGRRFLEEEAQHLKFLLKHRGVEVNHIGATLPDGGVNIKYLHQVLPIPVCLRLANELIMTGKQAW
jgi:glycine cleavage system H protein